MRPLVLMYHRVNTLTPDPWTTCVSPAHFAEHLEVLRSLPVTPMITFDDGYADNFENARLLLEKWEMPATIFAVSGCLGSPYEMWWDELDRKYLRGTSPEWDWGGPDSDEGARTYRAEFLRYRSEPFAIFSDCRPCARPERRMMTRDEIAIVAAGGLIEIGAHTVSHPVLAQLSVHDQEREILSSKRELEEVVGGEVTSFAYPNGGRRDYTQETVAICRAAGFRRAYAAWDAELAQDFNPFEIPRMMVRDWGGDHFASVLKRRLNGLA